MVDSQQLPLNHARPKSGAQVCICGSDLAYNERYDAYYCEGSDEWVEAACDEPSCFYCSGRPDKANKLLG